MVAYIKSVLKPIFYYFVFDERKYLGNAFDMLPGSPVLGLVDIGAAGGLEPRWKRIENYISYTGFEPDERSFNELKNTQGNNRKIYPVALWNSAQRLKINMCSKPQVSSYFLPNRTLLDRFSNSERFDVESVAKIECMTLDDLDILSSDFIKIDVQGGELSVLEGAITSLSSTFGIEAEVEFVPLYDDQPLFGEICSFLAKSNFEFIDFTTIGRWERNACNGCGQTVYADALFLKTPETVLKNHRTIEQLSNYLMILLIYYRFDLIDFVISNLSNEERHIFDPFYNGISPIRKKFNKARGWSNWSTRFIRLLGLNYKNHLIY